MMYQNIFSGRLIYILSIIQTQDYAYKARIITFSFDWTTRVYLLSFHFVYWSSTNYRQVPIIAKLHFTHEWHFEPFFWRRQLYNIELIPQKQVKNGDNWSLTSIHFPLLISKAFFRLTTSAWLCLDFCGRSVTVCRCCWRLCLASRIRASTCLPMSCNFVFPSPLVIYVQRSLVIF